MNKALGVLFVVALVALALDNVASRLAATRDGGERACLAAAFDSCERNSNDNNKCPAVARDVCTLR